MNSSSHIKPILNFWNSKYMKIVIDIEMELFRVSGEDSSYS